MQLQIIQMQNFQSKIFKFIIISIQYTQLYAFGEKSV